MELPDNGTEALGRGATFVAKADDPTAIHWNMAGLARQRGTQLYVGGNLWLQAYAFERRGAYPDAQTSATPWGRAPFPAVRNTAGPFLAPMAVVTSDLGFFDRVTFALGIFGPSTVANRTFPLGVAGAPSPARYDLVQSRSLITFPTLGVAARVMPWLDVGVGVHYATGNFDETSVAFTDLGRGSASAPGPCPNVEYQPCDGRTDLRASATAFGASFGALARPVPALAFGLSARTPFTFAAEGQATSTPPPVAAGLVTPPAPTRLTVSLPWVLRAGARFIVMRGAFERIDVELDGTYETWSSAQGEGPTIDIPELGPFKDIRSVVLHRYRDTFSVRAGGAFNVRELGGIVSLRAGAYFDASATAAPYTRVDYDTLSKVAGTLGAGYRVSGLTFNVAYGFVLSLPRTVVEGAIRPINPVKQGSTRGADDALLPAVNAGAHEGRTHVLSFSAGIVFDEAFGFGKAREVERFPHDEPHPAPSVHAEEPRAEEPVTEPSLATPPARAAPLPATEADPAVSVVNESAPAAAPAKAAPPRPAKPARKKKKPPKRSSGAEM